MKTHFEFSFFFSVRVEANLCYFFENWLMKLKLSNLYYTNTFKQNLAYFYLSEPILKTHFAMVDPVAVVFCYQHFSDLLWEKIVLMIKKNFWNLRCKAENLKKFWVH